MDGQMKNQASVSGGVDRPWQATVLGILDVVGVVFAVLMAVMMIFMQGALQSFFSSPEFSDLEAVGEGAGTAVAGLGGILGGMMVALGVFFVFVSILGIFMARGAFKGQRWSPITTVVLVVLAFLASLNDFEFRTSMLVGIVIDVFMIYLAVVCARHPFFGSK